MFRQESWHWACCRDESECKERSLCDRRLGELHTIKTTQRKCFIFVIPGLNAWYDEQQIFSFVFSQCVVMYSRTLSGSLQIHCSTALCRRSGLLALHNMHLLTTSLTSQWGYNSKFIHAYRHIYTFIINLIFSVLIR